MSKEKLVNKFEYIQRNIYSWKLYFFKIDNRKSNPYQVYNVKFKKEEYLTNYVTSLIWCIKQYQIDSVSNVEEYNGYNTKVSCDKILLEEEFISEKWENFKLAITYSADNKLNGKMQGYIIEGNKDSQDENILLIKLSNPVVNLNTKKTMLFSNVNEELDIISDDTCRLYLGTDMIVFEKTLYTFNHTFEKMFNLEKTLAKLKENSIAQIIDSRCFKDCEIFKNFAQTYKASRDFIELSEERLCELSNSRNLERISDMLNIPIQDNLLYIDTEEQTKKLIKYLCMKMIKESDTGNIYTATRLSKLDND